MMPGLLHKGAVLSANGHQRKTNMPDHELRKRTRNRYETEYKANFRTPDLNQAYSPPKLKPRGLDELFHKKPAELQSHDKHESERARDSVVDKRITHRVAPRDHDGPSSVSEHSRQNSREQQHKELAERPPSDRALHYRAGQALQMPRPIRQNFVSEYQRQFNWKHLPYRESPMLSADKMVFESKAEVPAPVKNINPPFKTEYQVQFSEFPTFEQRREDRQPAAPARPKEQKMTKPEPLRERPPEKQVMKYPAPSSPVAHSEYLSNFQPPSKYRYVKGAWLGAAPPHLMPSGDGAQQAGKCAQSEKHDAWYQQVLELRQRACSYKERALGGSEFMRVLRKLGEEQSQILRRAQENSAQPPAKVRSTRPRSEMVDSIRRHSEDLGSNRHRAEGNGPDRYSDDLGSGDEITSIGRSDSQSDDSR